MSVVPQPRLQPTRTSGFIRRIGVEPLTILAHGAGDGELTGGLRYVQAVTIDGRDFPTNQIEEPDLHRCRQIEFHLGDRPGTWGTTR